jgi:PqqD family protein of HPr-rel-A system
VIGAHYAADSSDAFSIVPLDALTAIYHRRSGVTHVVTDPVPQIIEALAGKTLSAEDLLSALAVDHEIVIDSETLAGLNARLDELTEVGLVSPV